MVGPLSKRLLLAAHLAAHLATAAIAYGDGPDDLTVRDQLASVHQFVDQGNFTAAEQGCKEILGRSDLPAATHAQFTAELVRVYAEAARNAEHDDRDELWRKSEIAGETFLREHPDNPQGLLVQLQNALAFNGVSAWVESRRPNCPQRATALGGVGSPNGGPLVARCKVES